MNSHPDSIIVDSCEYTPVYVIQNPSTIQGNSYVLSTNPVEKPVSNNLKSFYENSGNIENAVINTNNTTKPRILKRQDGTGNHLKLASFLMPQNAPKQYFINSVHFKPNVMASVPQLQSVTANIPKPQPMITTVPQLPPVQNSMPKFDIDRKIVKLTDIPIKLKRRPERSLPKTKPKDRFVPKNNSSYPNKHTSVQLLKLGETYHSLNQLSEEQMKIVTQALNIFSDQEKIAQEPTYDPVTNTKFIYKVVSPRDLTVVGKNKIVIKDKKHEVKREYARKVEEKPQQPLEELEVPLEVPPVQIKVTRSGRKVKLPRQILPEEEPHKPRKRCGTYVTCFQCSSEFSSLYRLQKHYENHPTHIPTKTHSNLFHCLLAIIRSSSKEEQTNIFIQQLEQLIVKLKSLLPCLLKTDGNEKKACTIGDDVGRLFGMNPGIYNLDIEAINCVKDKDGHCIHNPKSNQFTAEVGKPSQHWLSKHNEEIAKMEPEVEDCARINSVEKWPTVKKRVKQKQQKSEDNAKRMRKKSDSADTFIELGVEDLVTYSKPNDNLLLAPQTATTVDNTNSDIQEVISNKQIDLVADQNKKKGPVQFHSAHFDIRSSPIKPSSTVFCKFQIDPEKIAKYEVQIIRPLLLDNESEPPKTVESNHDNMEVQTLDNVETALPDCGLENVSFDSKDTVAREIDWIISTSRYEKSSDDFLKSNGLIEPALIHVKDDNNQMQMNDASERNNLDQLSSNDNRLLNQGESALNFLESLDSDCLYPETEIRNNSIDFHLDLFSFHNT